jgi:probable phosphoglycerate mutase
MRKTNKLADALDAIKKLDTLHLAENFEDVKTRTQSWLRAIAVQKAKSGGGNVLIVSHLLAIPATWKNENR